MDCPFAKYYGSTTYDENESDLPLPEVAPVAFSATPSLSLALISSDSSSKVDTASSTSHQQVLIKLFTGLGGESWNSKNK